ncbi:MAG: hypothetical protein JSS63_06450 [Bacteroidetes bacterium]|nr:hypothetical protein [Bacteroidota bacterium]
MENSFAGQYWNLAWCLIGFLGSMYGSIVFARWGRYKTTVRTIALARVHFEGYPIGINDLQRACKSSDDFWRLLENSEWSLRSEGQFATALKVRRLQSFVYIANAKIGKMLNLRAKNTDINIHFMAFQTEYRKIYDSEFIQFEKKFKPNWIALITLKPHPILPTKGGTETVDYFKNLNF